MTGLNTEARSRHLNTGPSRPSAATLRGDPRRRRAQCLVIRILTRYPSFSASDLPAPLALVATPATEYPKCLSAEYSKCLSAEYPKCLSAVSPSPRGGAVDPSPRGGAAGGPNALPLAEAGGLPGTRGAYTKLASAAGAEAGRSHASLQAWQGA